MHPTTTPLDEWPQGWLALEVASVLNEPLYIIMHPCEKRERGLPVTREEMRAFIRAHRAGEKGCERC